MMFTRDRLEADRLYFDRRTECYFVSPDGVGCYWYDNKNDVDKDYGVGNFDTVYYVETPEWF